MGVDSVIIVYAQARSWSIPEGSVVLISLIKKLPENPGVSVYGVGVAVTSPSLATT
jgi:hypothetical protein